MEPNFHPMSELFTQLGLPSNREDIENFIKTHRLKANDSFTDASFWNPSQKAFLDEALMEDSDWAEIVDQLNARLRH